MGEILPLKPLLEEVRKKLSPPGAWTQRAFATDGEGNIVDEKSPQACKWCLVGAMLAVAPGPVSPYGTIRHLPTKQMGQMLGTESISGWNDREGRTQEEVLEMLDRLIQAC